MMIAGKYYVGDLCYVMHDEWDDVMDLITRGRTDHNCSQGEFNLPDGRRFAMFSTAYGDGTYQDNSNNFYNVDSGSIGCILVSDISDRDKDNIRDGVVIDFSCDFEVSEDHGLIHIGHVSIDTLGDDGYDEDLEEDDYDIAR
jgi:hypothetical protein